MNKKFNGWKNWETYNFYNWYCYDLELLAQENKPETLEQAIKLIEGFIDEIDYNLSNVLNSSFEKDVILSALQSVSVEELANAILESVE